MKEILSIDFNRVAKEMDSSEVFGNELIISNLHDRRNNNRKLDNMPTVRLDAVIFFVCTHGNVSFRIDYKDHHLHKNMLLQLNHIHIMSNVSVSNDFVGYMVAVSPKLAHSILEEVQAMKKLFISLERSLLLIELTETETNCLTDIIARMTVKMFAHEHAFQKYIIKNEVSNCLLEIANIYTKQNQDNSIPHVAISYKEEIAQNFVSLVFSNCKNEHKVSFYAEKLCMTSGNLCRIIKAISGKTAVRWISDTLVIESKILLQKTDITIQQIAYELNFGNQSSFGKFFKKHTGETPTEFRDSLNVNAFDL